MKMLTTVAGLESGTVTLATKFNDTGTLRLDGGRASISDADRRAKGWMELRDGIAESRNVVAARLALGLGGSTRESADALHRVWERFGFGRPTGIDLAGEVRGIMRDPSVQVWREVDLANASFGQGVAVTPIQLAVAFAAMVNGGKLRQPRVVKAIGPDEVSSVTRGQVIDPALSPTLIGLMNHVVASVPFYAGRTLVPGYYVGGKTGTAQIWDPSANGGAGDWDPHQYSFSFVGFIGRAERQADLVVAVRIQSARPTVVKTGQLELPVMSFELFRRIATDAITRPSVLAELPPVARDTTEVAPAATSGETASPAIGGRP